MPAPPEPIRPPVPAAETYRFDDTEVVRRAEALVSERLGLATDAASAYLDGIAKATGSGLVIVATLLVETGELPAPPEHSSGL